MTPGSPVFTTRDPSQTSLLKMRDIQYPNRIILKGGAKNPYRLRSQPLEDCRAFLPAPEISELQQVL